MTAISATQTTTVAGTSAAAHANHRSCWRSIPVARARRMRTASTPPIIAASAPSRASMLGTSSQDHCGSGLATSATSAL